MPGQSLLLSVKLSYLLTGTSQVFKSYPRNYPNLATGAVWVQQLYGGSEALATSSAFFKAVASAQSGRVPQAPSLTILGLQPMLFYAVVAVLVVGAGVTVATLIRRRSHQRVDHRSEARQE